MDHHIILDIAKKDVHYWSPQLNFRVEQDEDDPNASIVSGLIGPRPPVWTMFMFIYFVIAVIGFFVSTHGISKWLLGEYSYYLLAIPVAIFLMLTARWVGKQGEQLAKDQIELLKQFVRDSINFENQGED